MGRRQDLYCKDCGCVFKLRSGKYGPFYSCSGWPICKSTMNLRDASLTAEADSSDRHDRDEEDMGIGMVVDE